MQIRYPWVRIPPWPVFFMLNLEKQKFISPRLGQVLITEREIAARVGTLADEIICAYDDDKPVELVIVAIMTGSMIFWIRGKRLRPLSTF